MMPVRDGQPVIAGAGIAGLMAALTLDAPCLLLTPAPLGQQAASALAQGGMAAAISADDSVAAHVRDTLKAGDGLCDPAVVRHIIAQGPEAVEELLALGVPFDRAPDGTLDLHLEAAHSHRRIVHARGDGSGAAIMDALVARVRDTPRITVLESSSLLRLDIRDGAVAGVWMQQGAHVHHIRTRACVIASGGLGGLYDVTTSPGPVRGKGLAIAARAGAQLADMEFVQFHPTALAVTGSGRAPLVSEAVRGHGATLIDETGARFTNELAPRDQVARAIAARILEGHSVFLDARESIGAGFGTHFPGIAGACHNAGIDPATMPIPVRPAVHYHMGGIATDLRGRSTVSGLWACGEAACTGLHGANRLASNSLLEAFVTGRAVGRDLRDHSPEPISAAHGELPDAPPEMAPSLSVATDHHDPLDIPAGILRDAASLSHGLRTFLPHIAQDDAALVGALVCHAGLLRQESRGAHYRTDFPQTHADAVRRTVTLSDLPLPCQPDNT